MAMKRVRSQEEGSDVSYKRKRLFVVDKEAQSVLGRAQSFSDLSPRLRSVGILTSGGDSQGMNAAIRAAVRVAMFKGCHVYGIKEGYYGLVNDMIDELAWNDVSGIMQLGGTMLGTARCADFRIREGRLRAAKNMVTHGISNLVVIGGDGSLTGANIFREEWPQLLEDLVKTNALRKRDIVGLEYLNVVGMVGSIDNDFCGTDITIGTDSALHRIVEAGDALTSTASSHQRSFVLEVMGRHCGYLALMSALACAADWVMVPEDAPSEGWEMNMCNELKRARCNGRRYSLVIVAEGAVDRQGKPITAQGVKQIIESVLQHDTRITVLGHVQRGGTPSAYDRILGCRYGAEAVLALLEATPETSPCVVAMQGNRIQRLSLTECVAKTLKVSEAMKQKDYSKAQEIRSVSFSKNLTLFKRLRGTRPPDAINHHRHFTFGVMNVGAPACGMNSAVQAFVRMAKFEGHKVMAIHDGFIGLFDGKALDVVKKSARSNRRRVFVVETMGGYCGYLATLAGLSGGADAAYIYEEDVTIQDLQTDLKHMIGKFRTKLLRGTIVRNERFNEHYSTQFLTSLYNAEGQGMFIARELVLGHLQQGGAPSPFDRCLGTKYGVQALEHLVKQTTSSLKDGIVSASSSSHACVLGVVGKKSTLTPVQDLKPKTDFKHRLPLDQWWLKLRPLIKVLAKHKSHRFEGERYQQERDGPETESEESMDLM